MRPSVRRIAARAPGPQPSGSSRLATILRRGIAALVVVGSSAAAVAREESPPSVPAEEGSARLPPRGDGVSTAASARLAENRPRHVHRTVRLAPLDTSTLAREDAARREELGPDWKRWNRVGVVREFDPVTLPVRTSRWPAPGQFTDGSREIHVLVSAPGATGVRVHFARCVLPPGSEVTVADADEDAEAYGPLRPPGDGSDWFAPTVFGEKVLVGVRVPAEQAAEPVHVTIDGAIERYAETPPSGTRATDPSISCIPSVATDSARATTLGRAVALIEFQSGRNYYLCSGALVADSTPSTQIPWFLTANHCISTERAAQTVECYWDYRAETPGGPVPSLSSVPRTLGATLVATTSSSDCTLLRLTGTLPSNRYFCGWTVETPTQGTSVTGVHHPQGADMRISYGEITAVEPSFHWVVWSEGVTAEGSSGSPIVDAEDRVLGQLYGGGSYCATPYEPDNYGRFDVSHASILRSPLGDGSDPAYDAWDPGDDTRAGATLLATGGSSGTHSVGDTDAEDWFAADLVAGTRYVFSANGSTRAELYESADVAVPAASSGGSSSGFSVPFTATSTARHYLAVSPVTASSTSYTVRLSEVVPVPPAAATHLRARATAPGTVRLKWRDRASGERGYRVELEGPDGWVLVGDRPPGSRTFRHVPGAGRHRYRVGPWDDDGTSWREVGVRARGPHGPDVWDPEDDCGVGAGKLTAENDFSATDRAFDRHDPADWYRIDLAAGATWDFTVDAAASVGLAVFADAGGLDLLAEDTLADGPGHETLEFTAPASGSYWVRATRASGGRKLAYGLTAASR